MDRLDLKADPKVIDLRIVSSVMSAAVEKNAGTDEISGRAKTRSTRHVIHTFLLAVFVDRFLSWQNFDIRTNIRTNIDLTNTNIRRGLRTTNANANISKTYEYVFVPTPRPRENAEIRISSCMRTCPYCGKRHSNASRLRKHLRQRKYRERNIFIAQERPGAIGVGYFFLPLYPSGRFSYSVQGSRLYR